uniref:PHD finger protein 11 n=1 Tax=Pavo cristatus TaxID=9049 RepID=A0A8C9FY34_PAVCR
GCQNAPLLCWSFGAAGSWCAESVTDGSVSAPGTASWLSLLLPYSGRLCLYPYFSTNFSTAFQKRNSLNLFSSGFVESEEYNPENLDLRFDVESVLNELKRGKRLVCNFCRKKGATVGCEERACRRSYHYFCALCDDAAIETDEVNGVYRYLTECTAQDPKRTCSNRSRMFKSVCVCVLTVRIDFLRKCKQAGLLDGIFEEMLDTLHLAQEKLMDDNTSETGMEVCGDSVLTAEMLSPQNSDMGPLSVLGIWLLSCFCSWATGGQRCCVLFFWRRGELLLTQCAPVGHLTLSFEATWYLLA